MTSPATTTQHIVIRHAAEQHSIFLDMNENSGVTEVRTANGQILGTYPGPIAALTDFFSKIKRRAGNTPLGIDVDICSNMLSLPQVADLASQGGLTLGSIVET